MPKKKRAKKRTPKGTKKKSGSKHEKPKSQNAGILSIVKERIQLWHTPSNEPFATVSFDDHDEHYELRNSNFLYWINGEYWRRYGEVPNKNAVEDIVHALKGRALHDGETHEVFLRSAKLDEAVVIDLCNEKWEAVVIDKHGWRITSEPGARFRRTKAMLPIPQPVRGGAMKELLTFLNVEEEEWPLIACWLIAALLPTGPYCVLFLSGEQGTAKTTTAKVLRNLVDPSSAPTRSMPSDERNTMIGALNNWLVCLDNLSQITPGQSDTLCRLATGAAFATRRLHKDSEELIIQATRPIIITSIGMGKTRSDLLDRSIVLRLPVIFENERKTEKEFWAAFDDASPRIMGAICEAISHALRSYNTVTLEEKSRMADFIRWSVAAEEGMGLKPGSFVGALEHNKQEANQIVLEEPLIAIAINNLLRRKAKHTGMAQDLHKQLLRCLPRDKKDRSKWPKDPRAFSEELNRIAPNLRANGIDVSRGSSGRDSDKRKVITLENTRFEETRKTMAGRKKAGRKKRSGKGPTPKKATKKKAPGKKRIPRKKGNKKIR